MFNSVARIADKTVFVTCASNIGIIKRKERIAITNTIK